MEYKGVILTNHILARMKERGISYEDMYWVFSKPDEVIISKKNGSKKFYRNYKGKRWSVVAKKNEEDKWVLLTCWIKDLNSYSNQNFKKYKSGKKERTSFWNNLMKMIFGK